MGGKSGNVAVLVLSERARMDPVRFLKLRRDLGDAGAAQVIQRMVEALAVSLSRMESARHDGEVDEFCRLGRRMARLAGEAGLERVGRVAEDVVDLAAAGTGTRAVAGTAGGTAGGNDVAADATWARLSRLCAGALGATRGAQEGRV